MPTPLDLNILPVEESDTPALAAIESAAFEKNCGGDSNRSLIQTIFGLLSEPGRQRRAEMLVELMRRPDATLRMYKAVLRKSTSSGGGDGAADAAAAAAAGKIVGWASWNLYDDGEKGSPTTEEWVDIEWPTARNPAACNDYFRSLSSARKRHIAGAKCASMLVLFSFWSFLLVPFYHLS
jgi:hypothetical protein